MGPKEEGKAGERASPIFLENTNSYEQSTRWGITGSEASGGNDGHVVGGRIKTILEVGKSSLPTELCVGSTVSWEIRFVSHEIVW